MPTAKPEYYVYRAAEVCSWNTDIAKRTMDQIAAEGWRLISVDNGISYWERLGKL